MPAPKLNLRLPPDLREEATMVAAALGMSLNAFIVEAVRSWTGYRAKQVIEYRQTLRAPAPAPAPAPARVPKVGPNEPCPCGSGQKYKRCHGRPGQV